MNDTYLVTDESGWAWFIPLHDGTTSVGIVMNQDIMIKKKKSSPNLDSESFYLQELKRTPALLSLIGDGTLVKDHGQVIRSASDYSYSATSYAGPNHRCIGDAAGVPLLLPWRHSDL
jgi:flavin-dependent dehydrogenase